METIKTMSDEDFKKKLTPEQYQVLRKGQTETAFTSDLLDNESPRTKSPRFLSENASFRHLHPWTKSPRFSVDKNKEKGHYTCAACGNELFSSETKF